MAGFKTEAGVRTRTFATHDNDVRWSTWTLIQQDDGTLHVEQRARYADGDRKQRVVPINDFLQEDGPPPRALQAIIDLMFLDSEVRTETETS